MPSMRNTTRILDPASLNSRTLEAHKRAAASLRDVCSVHKRGVREERQVRTSALQ
jgi:hypothetical protein